MHDAINNVITRLHLIAPPDGDRALPQEAVAAIRALLADRDALEKERDHYRRECDLLTHKVIACGVAATHPDATLTERGAYKDKWDSQQAGTVRALRKDRDALARDLAAARELLREALPYLRGTGWGTPGVDLPERIDAHIAATPERNLTRDEQQLLQRALLRSGKPATPEREPGAAVHKSPMSTEREQARIVNKREPGAARPCTCHPDDNPPRPCPQKYALSECRAAAQGSRA